MTQATSSDAYDGAVSEIRSRLLSGVWSPGAQLPSERALSEELGCSRATIREALRSLERVGLIEIRPKVGVFHRDLMPGHAGAPTLRDVTSATHAARSRIVDCIEARKIVECGSLPLVGARLTPQTAGRLVTLLEESRGAVDDKSAVEFDRLFHIELHAASGNPVIRQSIINSFDLLWEYLPLVLDIDGRRERSWGHHRAILAALEAGDVATAVSVMDEHLDFLMTGLAAVEAGRPGRSWDTAPT